MPGGFCPGGCWSFDLTDTLLNKILPTTLGACKPTFHIFYTSYLVRRRCFYHTDFRMQYFTIFRDKLQSCNTQNSTKHAWALSKTVQKNSKIPCTASRFLLLTRAKFSVNIKRFTLQHNKELIVYYFFLFNGFITTCILKKPLIRVEFWVLLQAMFMNDWKQTAKRLKLKETTNNQ